MTVKIDKDVPFPVLKRYRTRYPWHDLQVGDSFVYDGSLINAKAAAAYHSNDVTRFAARISDKSKSIVRIWRTA